MMRFRIHSRLLIFVVLLPACPLLGCAGKAEPPTEEKPRAPVKAVTTRALSLGEWTELLGTTQPLPDHTARVTAAVEGHVVWVLGDGKAPKLTEGQKVHERDVIVQLDSRLATATLRDLKEQQKQAKIAVDLAQLGLESKHKLWKDQGSKPGNLVSELELKQAGLALEDAQSKQAGLAAKVEAGEVQLDLLKLRAPIDGQLGLIQVVPGQTLTVGATVAEVVNLDEIDVLCWVPLHIRARLSQGKPARVVKDPGQTTPASTAQGKVVFIGVQADPNTGNFPVKVRFPNPKLLLQANTVLRVQVQTEPEKRRVTIPETALMEDQDPPAVIVVEDVKTETKEGKEEKLGKARRLLVKRVGVRDRDWKVVEILELEDPEKKVTVPLTRETLFVAEGGQGLETGDDVKLTEEEEEEEK